MSLYPMMYSLVTATDCDPTTSIQLLITLKIVKSE
jgi:hypothetical protein